jgi:hypothetical protein
MYYPELLRASEGMLNRWSRLHLQSLAPTNPHWARVVGYGPFFLCIIHKEGLCSSSGDINRLLMMMKMYIYLYWIITVNIMRQIINRYSTRNKFALFFINECCDLTPMHNEIRLILVPTSLDNGSMATLLSTYISLPTAIQVVITCDAIIPQKAPLPLATGHSAANTNTPSNAPDVAEVTSRDPSTTPPTTPTHSDKPMITNAGKLKKFFEFLSVTN